MVTHYKNCLAWAGVVVLVAAAWQLFTVYACYDGNWTGLYCFGADFPVPPGLEDQHILVRPDTGGYDGQFYYYIAQDPFFRKGYASGIDLPRFRYRRILVPLLAHIAAAGNPSAIAVSFALLNVLATGLGAYWLSRYAQVCGRHAAWGLAFLGVPAVLISLDRQTIDAALAACCVGFALYAKENRPAALFAVLAAAMLTRETGLLLVGAAAGAEFLRGKLVRSLAFAAAALPALAWYAFVHAHTAAFRAPLFDVVPLRAWFDALAHPPSYADFGTAAWLPRALDRIGLLGAVAAMGFAVMRLRIRPWDALALAGFFFATLAAWHSAPGGWSDVYGYGRTFTPLFLLTALDGLARGWFAPIAAAAMPLPRVLLQLLGQAVHALKG